MSWFITQCFRLFSKADDAKLIITWVAPTAILQTCQETSSESRRWLCYAALCHFQRSIKILQGRPCMDTYFRHVLEGVYELIAQPPRSATASMPALDSWNVIQAMSQHSLCTRSSIFTEPPTFSTQCWVILVGKLGCILTLRSRPPPSAAYTL